MGEFLRKAFDEGLALFFQFGREFLVHLFGQFGLVFQFSAGRGNAQYGFLAFIPAPGAAQNPFQPLPNVFMAMKGDMDEVELGLLDPRGCSPSFPFLLMGKF